MWLVYFGIISQLSYRWRLLFLFIGSCIFYAYWLPVYLPLLLISILFNYCYGAFLRCHHNRCFLIIGISIDLLPLAFFKYANFVIQNLNEVFLWTGACKESWPLLHLVLPLGISFFTFQEIAYLVDCYHGEVEVYSPLEFAVFISFWPQLIAGPILHHSELIPQLKAPSQTKLQIDNILPGLSCFAVGAFKKLFLADALAPISDYGFSHVAETTSAAALLATVCYSFQLYFDFSGYCDMAYGSARLFNIEIPSNFISPYKSCSIQDFWKGWHTTLSRWLRDYVYIPLGGSRCSPSRTVINLFSTFLIGGIWHGAGWTFVIWGAIHGAAVAVCHLWRKTKIRLPRILGWTATMLTVMLGWVFFRAESVSDALLVFGKILKWDTFLFRTPYNDTSAVLLCALSFMICLLFPNTRRMSSDLANGKHEILYGSGIGVIAVLDVLALLSKNLPESPFLYFQF